jgi:hypothetical protein
MNRYLNQSPPSAATKHFGLTSEMADDLQEKTDSISTTRDGINPKLPIIRYLGTVQRLNEQEEGFKDKSSSTMGIEYTTFFYMGRCIVGDGKSARRL